jgi:hypothetical protein
MFYPPRNFGDCTYWSYDHLGDWWRFRRIRALIVLNY